MESWGSAGSTTTNLVFNSPQAPMPCNLVFQRQLADNQGVGPSIIKLPGVQEIENNPCRLVQTLLPLGAEPEYGMRRKMVLAEGRPFDSLAPQTEQGFMTLPGFTAPISVNVDCFTASKKADRTRRRNAKASMTQRMRVKRIEEIEEELQRLRDESQRQKEELNCYRDQCQQLKCENIQLKGERDWYRDNQNRSKDVETP